MVKPAVDLLTIMAHPDDAELWAGATIAAAQSAVIAVTAHDPIRDAEAAAGAGILGARLERLPDVSVASVQQLLRRLAPQVVITHHVDDVHPDHRRTAEIVISALPDVVIETGLPARVYTCDGYNNLDRHGRPIYLPIMINASGQWETKIRALRSHSSQPIVEHFGPMAEVLGRLHGLRIGTQYAEAFAPVPVLGRLPETAGLFGPCPEHADADAGRISA
ncbi:PIG-L deacetylase family protein [Actinoplanes sp. L3-i22]|uniref:PIG-L deacetylase family protein n=1 Tax=Actinoplanes sp. L3-i22 TaxID=2836373 RepID=UPI001C7609F7|nr:PIG-L family deacetylase [Actinoplanes sp. L3-i22]BCY11045.1 PIG-L domain-containing protein [Actinoplanes sp. L3-i22]